MNCASCGHENRPGAKFCEECAAPLRRACASCAAELRPTAKFCDECAAPTGAAGARNDPPAGAAARQRLPESGGVARYRGAETAGARKIVTTVFADLAGSTALHERVDAESARRLMERYYEALRAAVEEHGGTVVKLLGDGVMAAFGVPQVAEDDAIRAVRAGVAMQQAFRALASEQSAALGEVGLRVAVNTGEVVVSGTNDDIVGDPVNVAARLQQEARDGDVVVGEATRRLVASLVTLEPLGTFALKGRLEAVTAYRVVSLERPAGAAAMPFVGRETELSRIMAVYETATATPTARLAVLLGSPGLGKSRLIDELGRRLGDRASIITARCDATGSATFAPIADALRDFLGIEDTASTDVVRESIEASLPGEDADRARVANGIAALLAGTPASPEETFFVIRRLLRAFAEDKPVVLVVDDLQWAEPLLLDLVEHLIQWGAGVPGLVLVGARPELRAARSSLVTTSGLVADVITLGGLDAGAATRLAAHVIGATDLPAAVAAKVLASSEGNPLFVGELVRMLVHEGVLTQEGDRWIVGAGLAEFEMPPTIHALLAARIERLFPEDRAVLERAAVIGRNFSRNAVAELLPRDVRDLDQRLESLQRNELIERDAGWFLGEPVLRFHHALIRDAAYRRLLKGTRAELHSRLADWIEGKVGNAVEQDETIGWHLEQAHQLLGELGPIDDQGRLLGERAARRLAAAGRRALARDDVALAANLLGRALGRLDAEDPSRPDLTLDGCEALLAAGDVVPAAAAIDELGRLAAGSERLQAWHACFVGQLTGLTAPEELGTTAEAVAAAAAKLTALEDLAGEAKAHFVHAQTLARLGKVGACEAALDLALAAARKAGDRRRANAVLAGAPLAALWGPSPVTRASGRCLDVVRVLRITQGAPAVEAVALSCQGVLEALRGRTDAARRMVASSRKMIEELGISHRLFEADVFAARIDLLEGNAPVAERGLRSAYEGLRDLGLGSDAAQAAALLARALLLQDRAAEAETLSLESEALAGDDLQAAIAWRRVRAEALARRGETERAVEFAEAAVAIAAATDAFLDHADARLALAAAFRAAGRSTEADAEERRAVELWEAKGATLLVEQATSEEKREDSTVATAARAAATPPLVQRRIRENAATALNARIEAAFRACDLDALDALLGDSLETIEHPTGVKYGREGQLETCRRMVRIPGLDLRAEPLATLGDSLCLLRRVVTASGTSGGSFDVGSYETEHFVVNETDGAGRLGRSEVFAPDRLGDAIACLYARYADSPPEGPARTRATGTARAVAAMLTRSNQYRPEDGMVPDFEAVDHRTVGFGAARGADAVARSIDAWKELSNDWGFRVDDVIALDTNGLLRRTTTFGKVRASGGEFETSSIALSVFGSDGRVTRYELFEIGHEAEALARFDELTEDAPEHAGTALTAGGETEVAISTRRRVRPNAATAEAVALDAAVAAKDTGRLLELFADDLMVDDHTTGGVYGRGGGLASFRSLIGAEDPACRHEPLATLGDSMGLFRFSVSASGIHHRTIDIGAYEKEEIHLNEVDSRGRRCRAEVFAKDRLGDAIVRFYERYAELVPAGPAHDRVAIIARAVRGIRGLGSFDELTSALAADVECIDHRLIGTWSASGRHAALEQFNSLRGVADDVILRDEDVLFLSTDVLLTRRLHSGTHRTGGGAYERGFHILLHFGDDGRVTRIEFFDESQESEALALVDAIASAASTSGSPAPRHELQRDAADPFANAATRFIRQVSSAWSARDWSALEALHAPAAQLDDRRSLMRMKLSNEDSAAQLRILFDVPGSRWVTTPIATRGERLSLIRAVFQGNVDAEGGALEIESLFLAEVDEQGRGVAFVTFDPDDLDAAYAELDARYRAGEAAAHGIAVVRSQAFTDALNRRDWNALAAQCAPGFHQNDHRLLGWGTMLADVQTFIRSQQALVELSPDARYRFEHIRSTDRATLSHFTQMGTREGGAFESPMLYVAALNRRGKNLGGDIYDVDRFDEARSRFEELSARPDPDSIDVGTKPRASSAGSAKTTPGATPGPARKDSSGFASIAKLTKASVAMDGWEDAFVQGFANGDWDAMRRMVAPAMIFEDRQRFALVSGDVELMIASAKERVGAGARPEVRRIGQLGDRVVVSRMLWAGGPADGRFEIEYHAVMEVDETGLIAAIVLLDDADAAIREAWKRWAAIEPVAARWVDLASTNTARFNAGWASSATVEEFMAERLVVDDHRRTGMGRIEGRDAYFESLVALRELAPDSRLELGWYWPVYDRHAAVSVVRRSGTLADGGEYESEHLILWVLTGGRVTRMEFFELEHLDKALARFEELRDVPPDATSPDRKSRDPLRIPPNAATRAVDAWAKAFEARDLAAAEATEAPSFVTEDLRPLFRLTSDRAMNRRNTQWALDMDARLTHTLVATAGDRLALHHLLASMGDEAAPSEIEWLEIDEVNDDGLLVRTAMFDPADRVAAFDDLVARYLRAEAEHLPALAFEFMAAWNDHDIDRLRKILPDDIYFDDRRRTGVGRLDGREAYLASLVALFDLSRDVRLEPRYQAAVAEHGRVIVSRWYGTNMEGGEFESVYVLMSLQKDGQFVGAEVYEIEDLDTALARFESLRPR